jgi:uncharacterized UPF0160 family protein
MKIATHDSSFHTDDIFAVATLLLKFPNAEVVRSRKPEVHAECDFVVDTGMLYDPEQNRFDHHMPEGAGVRENGIPYASFGLVWKKFGEGIAGGVREAEIIDIKLVQPVDAHDNGVAIAEYRFEGVSEYTIGHFMFSYLTKEDNTAERLHEVFMNNVGIAKELLIREIIRAKDVVVGEGLVQSLYEKSADKRLIELLDENELPWKQVLSKLPEPIFVLYKRRDDDWGVKAVPDTTKPYGHNRRDFPKAWAGLEGKKLQEVSGVSDASFAHAKLFMVAAKSKEGALELAEKALNN